VASITLGNVPKGVVLDSTRKDNILDILLANEPLTVCNVNVAPPEGCSDHCQINFAVTVACTNATMQQCAGDSSSKLQVFDWHEADFTGMSYYLDSADWLQ
jgi:hypothetical protein